MQDIFSSPVYTISRGESIHVIKSFLLLDVVVPWEENRPIDKTRLPEIVRCIKETGVVHHIIYVAKLNREKGMYVCIDGIHRMEALRYLREQGMQYDCVVHLITDFTVDLFTRFKYLNSSIIVPGLYLMDKKEKKDIKHVVEDVVTKIGDEWPNFISPSNRPQRPNYNVSRLTDLLTAYVEKHREITSDELFSLVTTLNEKYKKGFFTKDRAFKKAKTYGFYLFLKSDFTEDL